MGINGATPQQMQAIAGLLKNINGLNELTVFIFFIITNFNQENFTLTQKRVDIRVK